MERDECTILGKDDDGNDRDCIFGGKIRPGQCGGCRVLKKLEETRGVSRQVSIPFLNTTISGKGSVDSLTVRAGVVIE